VQRGDNLFRIALRYGLTTDELAAANNITDPTRIFAGQVLVIPAP
jgi:2',3'-cyclic-nucleotide 2'-phosphodiesterase/3'-nucleotidase